MPQRPTHVQSAFGVLRTARRTSATAVDCAVRMATRILRKQKHKLIGRILTISVGFYFGTNQERIDIK